MSIEAVVNHAYEMQQRSGIRFDEDGIRQSVEAISFIVGVKLNEADIVKVCDAILAQQEAEFPMYAGLPVISLHGESDSDEHDHERYTGEMAVGVLTQRDDRNAQWNVLFTNGTTVWITDEELADINQYMVRRHDDLSFLSSKRADGRNWGTETNEWSASMDFRGEPPNAPGINYFVNLEATAGDDFEADNIDSEAHGPIEVGYLVSVDDGSVEIARGTIAHEGDRTDLLGHIQQHADQILAEVFEALRHPGDRAEDAIKLTVDDKSVQDETVQKCDEALAKAGLPTFSELIGAVTQARQALRTVATTPAGAGIQARESRSQAWKALHGCILSDERKQIVFAAQQLAAKHQTEPVRNYEDAVRIFGFSVLQESTITHPRLKTLVGSNDGVSATSQPQAMQRSFDQQRSQLIQAIGAVATTFKTWKAAPSPNASNLMGMSILELRKCARQAGLKSSRFDIVGSKLAEPKAHAALISHDLVACVNRVLDADMVAASNGGGAFTRHVVPELNLLESLAIGHGIVQFMPTVKTGSGAIQDEPKLKRPRM